MNRVLPTQKDEDNLTAYLVEQKKLFDYNRFLLLAPQVASHFIIKIRAASAEDYYFPVKFRDSAMIVEITHTAKSCLSSSCYPGYPRGKICKPKDGLQPFKSGDDVVVGCNPACFNLLAAPQNESIQSPLVDYNPRLGACIYQNLGYHLWGTDDFYRASEPTPNVTDIGTGFNAGGEFVAPDGTGINMFEINADYCNHFNLEFIEDDDKPPKCDTTKTQDVVGFLMGSYIYQLMSFGGKWIDKQLGLETTVRPPGGSPPTEDQIPEFLRSIGLWRNDIRPSTFMFKSDLRLSDLGIVSATRHMTWTNEFRATGQLQEPLLLYEQIPITGFTDTGSATSTDTRQKIDFKRRPNYETKNVPEEFKITHTGFRKMKKTPPKFRKPLDEHLKESRFAYELAVLDSIFSFETAKSIYLGILFDDFVGLLKRVITKMITRVNPILMKAIETATVALSRRLVLSVARSLMVQVIARQVANLAVKAIATAGKIAVFSLSALTWVLIVFNIVDLALTIFDPYNLNTRTEPTGLEAMAKAALKENITNFGRPNKEYDMEMMLTLIEANTPEATITELYTNNFKHFEKSTVPFARHKPLEIQQEFLLVKSAEFMLSFEFNSDGSAYRWADDMDDAFDVASVNRQIESLYPDIYLDTANYNFHFKNRLSHFNAVKNYSIAGLVATGAIGAVAPPIIFYMCIFLLMILLIYSNNVMFTSDAYIDKIARLQYTVLQTFVDG